MEILAYCAAILIGVSLGMIGSGGSILTVPVLVYLLHMNPILATTSSLFIVGVTSFIGSLRAYSRRQIDFRTVTEFGIPSLLSIFVARHFILPALPAKIFSIGNMDVSKEMFLMVLFAILMFAAAISIIFHHKEAENKNNFETENLRRTSILVLLGLAIGLVTGLLGAGGGFLIIPSLVLLIRLNMKSAVGTSLLLIAINSLFGFLFTLKQFDYNWKILISFTLLAILGLIIGSRFADKLPAKTLKKGFGWFVLIIAFYILINELVIV
jgi:uncharacterized protein